MDDEARTRSGLDPRREPRGRPPWGRRWPPRHARHDDGPQHHARTAYAALDLGTNNCRLLVARPNRDGFRVIDAFSRIIRLGEGMAASGRLGDAAIERAMEALAVCRDKMHNRGVTRARLIATEACRSAANGVEFRDRVKNEVGLELEIVDRETEAGLAAIGCTPLMDPSCRGRHPVRHRRRLVGNRAARPQHARPMAGRRYRTSAAGPRCRSASCRSPSAMAA